LSLTSGGGKGGEEGHPPRAALCRGGAFGGAKIIWNSEMWPLGELAFPLQDGFSRFVSRL